MAFYTHWVVSSARWYPSSRLRRQLAMWSTFFTGLFLTGLLVFNERVDPYGTRAFGDAVFFGTLILYCALLVVNLLMLTLLLLLMNATSGFEIREYVIRPTQARSIIASVLSALDVPFMHVVSRWSMPWGYRFAHSWFHLDQQAVSILLIPTITGRPYRSIVVVGPADSSNQDLIRQIQNGIDSRAGPGGDTSSPDGILPDIGGSGH